jgi:hypothetical protein
MYTSLSDLSPLAAAVVVVGSLIVLAITVAAAVLLMKADERTLTLPRVVWAIVILMVTLAGPVAFLVAGRRRVEAVDAPVRAAASPQQSIDKLYEK